MKEIKKFRYFLLIYTILCTLHLMHSLSLLKHRKSFYPDSTVSGEYFAFEGKEISTHDSNDSFLVDYACDCRSSCSERFECSFVSIIYHANSSVECRLTYYNPVLVELQNNEDALTVFKRKNRFFPALDGFFYKYHSERRTYYEAKSVCQSWSSKTNARLVVAIGELEAKVLKDIAEVYNEKGLTMVDLTTANGTCYWGDNSKFDDDGIIRINIQSIPNPPLRPVMPGVYAITQAAVGYRKTMFEYCRKDMNEKMPFICQANPAGI